MTATIDALHLSISDSETDRNIHLLENGDLSVILDRGTDDPHAMPATNTKGGAVVVLLDVDGDHDEVHYEHAEHRGTAEEVIGRAIEALTACRDALRRVGES